MRKPIIALAASCLLLAACAKPLPPDKAAYVGEWDGPTMTLLITPGGSVVYKHAEGNSSTSINAPLKAFVGNDFVVGVGPVNTTFKSPHRRTRIRDSGR